MKLNSMHVLNFHHECYIGHSWLFAVPKQVISQDVENQYVLLAAESTDRVGQRVSIVPRLVATSVRDSIMQLRQLPAQCHLGRSFK